MLWDFGSRIKKHGKDAEGYVYVIQDDSGACKIGHAKDVERRIAHLQTAHPSHLELIHKYHTEDRYRDETHLHRFFRRLGIGREWFALTKTEIDMIKRWHPGDQE